MASLAEIDWRAMVFGYESLTVDARKYLAEVGLSRSMISKPLVSKLEVHAKAYYHFMSKRNIEEITTFNIEYNRFCDLYPRWKGTNTVPGQDSLYLFWQIDKCKFGDAEGLVSSNFRFLVLRCQPYSEFCYLLAPIVAHHYLLSMQEESVQSTLNPTMIVHEQIDEVLSFQLFLSTNYGGPSKSFFESLISVGGTEAQALSNPQRWAYHISSCVEIEQLLREQGPALVPSFRCTREFATAGGQVSFTGEPKKDDFFMKTKHSMVLIGMRRTGDQFWFLLQNSWPHRFFIEVDSVYFYHCGSECVFIRPNAKVKLPCEVAKNEVADDNLYAEACFELLSTEEKQTYASPSLVKGSTDNSVSEMH